MVDISSQDLPVLFKIAAEGADQVAVDWQAYFRELMMAIDEKHVIMRMSNISRKTACVLGQSIRVSELSCE